MKRSENGRGRRSHGVLKVLMALLAIIAIFGPTVLVVSEAVAAPGNSGNGGNSGGGNGGGNGNGNGNGGAGAAGNGAGGVGGGQGNGVGGGNGGPGSGGGAGDGGGNAGGGSSGGGAGTGGAAGGGTSGGGAGTGGAAGGGTSGGGAGNGGSAGAGTAGSGGGAGASGDAGSGAGSVTDGTPRDTRLASTTARAIRVLPGGVRKGTGLLTPNQEYTLEVFNACKVETNVYLAVLTTLKPNGGFGFDNGEDNYGTQRLINCMASYGFTFANAAVTPVRNFAPVAEVPEPALVKKAEK